MNKELILRLSKYKRLLHKLKALGFERVFSNNLGDAIGVTPALVRKDFSLLHLPGNKRGGYQIDTLLERISEVLGKDRPKDIIIVGCGRIGTALMQYEETASESTRIVAGFDIKPERVQNPTKVPIYPLSAMPDFVREHQIIVGIIAVPDNAAAEVFDMMMGAGIKAVLNFASIELRSSKYAKCIIHNVNIGLELEHLFYQVYMEENLFPEIGN
ncbi:MAG TPA: redox-sensing transcriptional repressor Rex [Spirochaetia bacterium]|nr:redox-sensing transcriptional repressor Rex [Spirochaetia bacterium]